MTKAREAYDPEADREKVTNTMSPGGMCLLFMPRDLYVMLAKEAAKRGMTLADLLSRSVEKYLGEDTEQTEAQSEDFEHSNFDLVEVGDASKASREVKLKGWE